MVARVATRDVAGVQSARFLGATTSAVAPRSSACWEVAIVYTRLGRVASSTCSAPVGDDATLFAANRAAPSRRACVVERADAGPGIT